MFTFTFGRRATLHFVRERLVGVGTCGVCSNVGGREGGGVGGSVVVCVGLNKEAQETKSLYSEPMKDYVINMRHT